MAFVFNQYHSAGGEEMVVGNLVPPGLLGIIVWTDEPKSLRRQVPMHVMYVCMDYNTLSTIQDLCRSTPYYNEVPSLRSTILGLPPEFAPNPCFAILALLCWLLTLFFEPQVLKIVPGHEIAEGYTSVYAEIAT